MAKFSNTKARAPRAPMRTNLLTRTHEGGTGFEKDAKTALFTLATTNMVGEATFYESAETRDNRFISLVHRVTHEDPSWVQGFIPWLRSEALMRSASVVAAAEYVKAGGPNGRRVVNGALQRPDEPAEMVAYWRSVHGRSLPAAVKRGVADAVQRMYTERSALKYDGISRGYRMGDVIDIVHPKPVGAEQSALFRYLLDRRHNRDSFELGNLPMVRSALEFDAIPEDERRTALSPERLAAAGYTWEKLSGWLPGGMDAAAWEAVIPSMGYMALLRNLRNFEQAKISRSSTQFIKGKLADPDEVARSRQFPYRFFSAWVATGSMTWGESLEVATDLSVRNVPEFPGRTLVLVDTSASMRGSLSGRSNSTPLTLAALFGSVLSARSKADVAIYADNVATLDYLPTSILRSTTALSQLVGKVGHSTNTWPALNAVYDGQDRVVVLTDMQDHPARQQGLPDVPIYVWDLQGSSATNVDLNQPGRYLFSGFSDSSLRSIQLLESGRDAGWPWET